MRSSTAVVRLELTVGRESFTGIILTAVDGFGSRKKFHLQKRDDRLVGVILSFMRMTLF
jgi:hypothetical protein